MEVYVIQIPKLRHCNTNRTNQQLKHPEYISNFVRVKVKKKVKQSRYRLGVAQRVPGI